MKYAIRFPDGQIIPTHISVADDVLRDFAELAKTDEDFAGAELVAMPDGVSEWCVVEWTKRVG